MTHLTCSRCKIRMQIKKQGVTVVTMFNEPPTPYQLIQADLFSCPGCDAEIIGGYADRQFSEHFQPDFKEQMEKSAPLYVEYEHVGDSLP